MTNSECQLEISKSLSSSVCGAVFLYRNYLTTSKPHRKLVISHDKYVTTLNVISTTTKDYSMFINSEGFGEDIMQIKKGDYVGLTEDTWINCCEIEEISIDELASKCADADERSFKIMPPLPKELLREIRRRALESENTIRKYKKQMIRCEEGCQGSPSGNIE